MALFTIASVIYRWVVVLSILIFLNQVLEPYGLEIIGRAIGLVGVFGLVVQPTWQLAKFFHVPGRMHQVKRHRVIITLASVGAAILVVLFLPLPHYVRCSLDVEPRDAASVYVGVPGRLDEVWVDPGDQVVAGQSLARLTNIEMQLSLADLEGRRDMRKAQLANLRVERITDPEAGLRIREVESNLVYLEQQVQEKRDQLNRLELKAPISGTVLPPPSRSAGRRPPGTLDAWKGSPLDEKNLGCYLADSDLFCRIGDPQRLEAVLIIDQADIELVREGQPAYVKLDSHAGITFTTNVVEIAKRDLKVTPASLSHQAGGELATKTDSSGIQRPLSTSYQARAPLEEIDGLEGQMQLSLRGQAKIYTGWQPLGRTIWRYLAHTFHFRM
jgi:putative peptide zinc metalloprotease protein